MQLINSFEPTARSNYGGGIGFMGFDGSCIHAIMIRTFLSRNNTLIYQAGAGVVAASQPESELQEVNNKLGGIRTRRLSWQRIFRNKMFNNQCSMFNFQQVVQMSIEY